MRAGRLRLAALSCGLLWLGACTAEQPADPATVVVASIGERDYTVGDFARYLEQHVLGRAAAE